MQKVILIKFLYENFFSGEILKRHISRFGAKSYCPLESDSLTVTCVFLVEKHNISVLSWSSCFILLNMKNTSSNTYLTRDS